MKYFALIHDSDFVSHVPGLETSYHIEFDPRKIERLDVPYETFLDWPSCDEWLRMNHPTHPDTRRIFPIRYIPSHVSHPDGTFSPHDELFFPDIAPINLDRYLPYRSQYPITLVARIQAVLTTSSGPAISRYVDRHGSTPILSFSLDGVLTLEGLRYTTSTSAPGGFPVVTSKPRRRRRRGPTPLQELSAIQSDLYHFRSFPPLLLTRLYKALYYPSAADHLSFLLPAVTPRDSYNLEYSVKNCLPPLPLPPSYTRILRRLRIPKIRSSLMEMGPWIHAALLPHNRPSLTTYLAYISFLCRLTSLSPSSLPHSVDEFSCPHGRNLRLALGDQDD